MSRPSKGPRLYLRQGRIDNRTGRQLPAIWYIRDGQVEVSTGCGADGLRGPSGAESKLSAYIAAKWAPRAEAAADDSPDRLSDPARVLVAEVLALYAQEKAPKLADPGSRAASVATLLAWWGDKTVADIKRSTCEAYVAHRCSQPIKAFKADAAGARLVTEQGARRELEDLSAALGYWDDEHHFSNRPKVIMPEKPESPRDAFSRADAARLLMAARGYRITGQLHPSGRPKWKRLVGAGPANRAHLKRFVLVGVYTGTRPGVIPKLLWSEAALQAWADLDAAVIYRRGKREKEHKTKKRTLVKIPRRLLVHMRRWKRMDEKTMLARADADPPLATCNTVIHHGGRQLAGRIRKGYAGIVRDAGLPAEITPHWQRHAAATWLMQNGADLYEAAGFLGMTVKTLEDHYAHHRPDHQAGALKAMNRRS